MLSFIRFHVNVVKFIVGKQADHFNTADRVRLAHTQICAVSECTNETGNIPISSEV